MADPMEFDLVWLALYVGGHDIFVFWDLTFDYWRIWSNSIGKYQIILKIARFVLVLFFEIHTWKTPGIMYNIMKKTGYYGIHLNIERDVVPISILHIMYCMSIFWPQQNTVYDHTFLCDGQLLPLDYADTINTRLCLHLAYRTSNILNT